MYYYKLTEKSANHSLWTVMIDTNEGVVTDSDHNDREEAAERVSFLNGNLSANNNNSTNKDMKFVVSIDDFWFDHDTYTIEEALKTYITTDVVRQIKESMKTQIDKEIKEVVERSFEQTQSVFVKKTVLDLLKTDQLFIYDRKEYTIEEYLKERIKRECGWSSAKDQLEKFAKKFAIELKSRYDLQFAAQVVNKLSEQGLLKNDELKKLIQ